MKSPERARPNGALSIGLTQTGRLPCERRRNSSMNIARPTLATSACWPVAPRSGWKTQRLVAIPHNAAAAPPSASAVARIVAGVWPAASSAPSAAA